MSTDFFTKIRFNLNKHFKELSLLPKIYFFLGAISISISFGVFRFVQDQSHDVAIKALSGVLRNDYLNANSYAISKALADIEHLNIVQCLQMTEITNIERIFYDTSGDSSCKRWVPFFSSKNEQISLRATNGLEYEIKFQLPFSWSLFFLEIFSYFLLFFIWLSLANTWLKQKSRDELRIQALSFEKNLYLDQASQIKHDVASPIAAIRTIVSVIKDLDPEIKGFLIKAISRTEEIVNKINQNQYAISIDPQRIIFGPSIYEIVAEKEVLWNSKNIIDFVEIENLSLQVYANESSLKRILSNLLNNSYEAKRNTNEFKIRISTRIDSKFLYLIISDNGIGIPKSVLGKIGSKGFSFGKEGSLTSGSGLGIHHAIASLRAWGGDLIIKSEENKGTEIEIKFLLA